MKSVFLLNRQTNLINLQFMYAFNLHRFFYKRTKRNKILFNCVSFLFFFSINFPFFFVIILALLLSNIVYLLYFFSDFCFISSSFVVFSFFVFLFLYYIERKVGKKDLRILLTSRRHDLKRLAAVPLVFVVLFFFISALM